MKRFAGVVVGRVRAVSPHPNADRLRVCSVSIGDEAEPLEIVCGAPNVAPGQLVPVAPVGAKLPPTQHTETLLKPLKIKKSKVRGVESKGMICSAAELDFGDWDSEGILELPGDAEPGLPFDEYARQTGTGPYSAARQAYELASGKLEELSHLRGVAALAAWDQEVTMPAEGAGARAAQSAALAGVVFDRETDPDLRSALESLETEQSLLDPWERSNVSRALRTLRRTWNCPRELVVEQARLQSAGLEAWKKAREKSRFKAFQPVLADIVALTKEMAAATRPDLAPYDACLDLYSPGSREAQLVDFFDVLVPGVQEAARGSAGRHSAAAGYAKEQLEALAPFPTEQQAALSQRLVDGLGYRGPAGRLDQSAHPFTIALHPSDVRITTRYAPSDLLGGMMGSVHEAGHAMYEQGLPTGRFDGQPVALAAGLAVHESQSLLWERLVARDPQFWAWVKTVEELPAGVEVDDLNAALHGLEPGFIRVDADEVTYPLHIKLRFDIERRLLSGDLSTKDVPEAWNALSQDLLGLTPPTDAEGCLQDVHWAMGAVGYFPTYAVGAVYAHHLYEAATAHTGALEPGEYAPLREWLRDRVWSQGSFHETEAQLVEAAAGPLEGAVERYVGYLQSKYLSSG